MVNPPTNSATANCQPMSSHRTTPSSTTRCVPANMNTIEAVKSAPRENGDFARALAAYEQELLTMPKELLLAIVPWLLTSVRSCGYQGR